MSAESVAIAAPEARPSGRKRLLRVGIFFFMATVAAGLGTYAAIWYQERPLRRAETALREGAGLEALRLVDEFLIEHPDNSRALSLRARLLVEAGHPNEAIALFAKVGAASAAEMQSWARAYMHLQQWSQAVP